jgi:hypothetical protein
MSANASYSRQLRPLGQRLEALRIDSFALQFEGNGYVVAGQKRCPPLEKPEQSLWQRFRGAPKPSPTPPVFEAINLRFSIEELIRLDSEAQKKRNAAGGTSEAHSLSQILRAVGAFVEQKQGRLMGVTKDGQDIAIEYESALHRSVNEKFTVSSLYDYWVKMYLRRRARS